MVYMATYPTVIIIKMFKAKDIIVLIYKFMKFQGNLIKHDLVGCAFFVVLM